jgi:hypothetical protein
MRKAQERQPDGGISLYWLPDISKGIVFSAITTAAPADHKVNDYITKLLNREIETIEMELG